MKVLYINLEKDLKRRDFMENQLQALGFEYERVQAVDGRLLSEDEFKELYDSETSIKYNKKDLTRGEFGCASSHKKCHQIAINHDYTLILEDDIELPDNFKEIVEKEVERNNTKKKWDYLQFDYPEVGAIFLKRWFTSVKLYSTTHLDNKSFLIKALYYLYTSIKFFYIMPLSVFEGLRDTVYKRLNKTGPVYFFRPLYLTGCYVITKNAAKLLLENEKKIAFSSDRLHNQTRKTSRLILMGQCPLQVQQKRKEFGSSILGVESLNT